MTSQPDPTWDHPIETGGIDDGEEKLTVLKLLENEVRPQWDRLEPERWNALRNEIVISGFRCDDELSAMPVVDWKKSERLERNFLRGLHGEWTSRLLEQQQTVLAWPGDAGRSDAAAAEVANAILDHLYEVNGHPKKQSDLVNVAQLAGVAGIKSWWDQDKGRDIYCVRWQQLAVDPAGAVVPEEQLDYLEDKGAALALVEELEANGLQASLELKRMGEVRDQVVTVHDYCTDGEEFIEDSKWCAFRYIVDKWDAKSELMALHSKKSEGFNDPEVGSLPVPELETMKCREAWGPEKEGVELWEIWHKPTPRIPDGLFAVVIAGKYVTQAMPFPYEHGELPLSVLKIGKRRNHPWGTTHIDDARPVQEAIDAKTRLLRRLHNKWARYLRLSVSKDVAPQVHEEADYFQVTKESILRFEVPPLDTLYQHAGDIEREKQQLREIVGLELNDGSTERSGRAIYLQKQIESARLAEPALNLSNMQQRMYRQELRLAQQFYEDDRVVSILGDDGEAKAVAFDRALISGWDVKLEPAQGDVRRRGPRRAAQQEEAAAGMRDPNDINASGLEQSAIEQQDAQIVQMQVEAIRGGGFAQADPNVDPAVGVEIVGLAVEMAAGDDIGTQQRLHQLLLDYQLRAAQGRQAGQAGQTLPAGAGQLQVPGATPPANQGEQLPVGIRGGPVPQTGA